MPTYTYVQNASGEILYGDANGQPQGIDAVTWNGTNLAVGATMSVTGVATLGGSSAGELRLLEPSAGGTSYIALKAPALAANVTWTLPTADGSSGQFLKTNGSGTLSWDTITGGSGAVATDTIWDAKGDLAVGTGADTAQKLTVGTDGKELVADSTQTTGLAWKTRQTVATDIVGGRLSLESAVPLSTSDQSAKTSIYYSPYRSNEIALYDGSEWIPKTFSAISVAVPSTIFRLFDVFAYLNSGNVAIETLDWSQTTGSITAATGASVEVQVTSNSHGLSNGDMVGITGMTGNTNPNGGIWRVSSVATNTFNLQGCIGNGTYSGPSGTWHKLTGCTRATALAYSEGKLIKTGDASRRYLGTGMTTGTSGQCQDTSRWCFLWNYFNQVLRHVTSFDSGSHTLTSSAGRDWNSYTAGVATKARCGFVCGDAGIAIFGCISARKNSTNACNMVMDPYLNTASVGPIMQVNTTVQGFGGSVQFGARAAVGFNTLSLYEFEYGGVDSNPTSGLSLMEFLG